MAYLDIKRLKEILNKKKDINIFISDRAGRKSSAIQELIIENALNGNPSLLLRNKSDEVVDENYLSEYIVKKYPFKFYSKKINRYLSTVNILIDDKEIVVYFIMYISISRKYKSTYYKGFEKIKYVVYEECITEERLPQNSEYICKHSLKELFSLMSIYSTVCRLHMPQLILLGNDISYNILNPITVTFNLLERVQVDKLLESDVNINGKKYTFTFLYFSFPDSIEHWLTCDNIYTKMDNLNFLIPIITIESEIKKYYIYNENGLYYWTTRKFDHHQHKYSNIEKKFAFYFNEYTFDNAIQIIKTFFSDEFKNLLVEQKEIKNIKLNDLKKLTLNQAQNNKDLIFLKNIKDNSIYENIGIKYIIDELINKYPIF